MKFKELEYRAKNLVKFGFYLTCLKQVIETHYLELMQRFPNSPTKRIVLSLLMMTQVTF